MTEPRHDDAAAPDASNREAGTAVPPRSTGNAGPVPPGNRPGRHPEHEQDKPEVRLGAAFDVSTPATGRADAGADDGGGPGEGA
jgi:hypothetical protein